MAKHEGSVLDRGNVLLVDLGEDDADVEVETYDYIGRHRADELRGGSGGVGRPGPSMSGGEPGLPT
jgi:hypothetical protein